MKFLHTHLRNAVALFTVIFLGGISAMAQIQGYVNRKWNIKYR